MRLVTLHDRALAAQVRLQRTRSNAWQRLLDGAERRAYGLRDDGERGAQAAEYAMVGGIGAACCAACIELARRGFFERLWDAVFGGIQRLVSGWL